MLLLARGVALAWQAASPRWRVALAAAGLAAWLPLADSYVHCFRFIEQTGGQADLTFRTAAVEPKQAALRQIAEETRGSAFIVSSQWWIRWPMRYLALQNDHICVPQPEHFVSSAEYQPALAAGRVWFVDFAAPTSCGRQRSD